MERRKRTQQILERSLGKTISELNAMDLQEEIQFVEEKTRRPLVYSKAVDSRISARGNPYLVQGRLCTMEDINKKIVELKWVNGTTSIHGSFLVKYQEELEKAFQTYLDTINPFIIQYEILKGEFPIAIQNEIRAIYGHIVRAAMAEDEETAQRNIENIKSHTKRAVLDCYKYICIAYADNYTDFFTRYEGVDLSYIDNGDFLQNIHHAYQTAKMALQRAKKAELSNLPEDDLFELYTDAYECFEALNQRLTEAEDGAEFLKHTATLREKKSKRREMIGLVLTGIGVILAVYSLFS